MHLRLYPLGLLLGRLACGPYYILNRLLTLQWALSLLSMACDRLPFPLFGVRIMTGLCPNWAASV